MGANLGGNGEEPAVARTGTPRRRTCHRRKRTVRGRAAAREMACEGAWRRVREGGLPTPLKIWTPLLPPPLKSRTEP
jgi:hypothetical protein